MSIDRVKEYLGKFGAADRVLEFETSSATVELAANALSCEPARIAKSLTFLCGEQAVMVVLAGDAKVDNQKFKQEFHTKAKMLTKEQTVELVGHAVGGVCPFAINEGVSLYLDVSLQRFQTVFPACGSSNSAIELNMEELYEYSNPIKWVDIGKLG